MRNVTVRDAVLSATGHGYWPAAVALAIVGGIIAVAGVFARHFRAGLHDSPAVVSSERWKVLAARLAALQICIYLLQETFERIAAHAPLQTLVQNRLLFIGFLAQISVAFVVAGLLTMLGRAARAAGRVFARSIFVGRPQASVRRTLSVFLRSRIVLGIIRTRAPPLPMAAY
jgi:hypothetical protein